MEANRKSQKLHPIVKMMGKIVKMYSYTLNLQHYSGGKKKKKELNCAMQSTIKRGYLLWDGYSFPSFGPHLNSLVSFVSMSGHNHHQILPHIVSSEILPHV